MATTNPFEELQQLFDRMSRQFQEATAQWSDEAMAEWRPETRSLATDVIETDDEFVVHVDLPGFENDDVDVQVTDSTLRIVADRSEAAEESTGRYVRRERSHARAERSIRLPTDVDTDAVDAEMNNGVLTISLPKVADASARSIEVH